MADNPPSDRSRLVTPADIEHRALALLAAEPRADGRTPTRDSSMRDDLCFDDLACLSLLVGLEDAFDIEITDDAWEDARTWGGVLDLVARLLPAAVAA